MLYETDFKLGIFDLLGVFKEIFDFLNPMTYLNWLISFFKETGVKFDGIRR